MSILHGLLGLLALLCIAWLLSEERKAPPWRIICGGVLLQIGLALLIKFEPAAKAFLLLDAALATLMSGAVVGMLV